MTETSTTQDFITVAQATDLASYKRIHAQITMRQEGRKMAEKGLMFSIYDKMDLGLAKMVLLRHAIDEPETAPHLLPHIFNIDFESIKPGELLEELKAGKKTRRVSMMETLLALSGIDDQKVSELRQKTFGTISESFLLAVGVEGSYSITFDESADAAQKLAAIADMNTIKFFERFAGIAQGLIFNEGGVDIASLDIAIEGITRKDDLHDAITDVLAARDEAGVLGSAQSSLLMPDNVLVN